MWVMLPKTNSFATGHAAKLILCHLMLRTAANTCGSTVSCASKWSWFGSHVVGACGGTSCGNLHWHAQPGLQRELGMCGAMSCLQLDLSASTCAWSRLALCMLGIVCSLCQRLWREPCGMCCTKGELFQMRRASKSWSSVLQYFCCTEQGQLHRKGARGTVVSIWLHGLHTPWDVVAAVCSLAWLCIFGLNCFLAGRSDAIECNCRIAIWQTQSYHGYYFCCVVWGKYRVCGVAFVWSCGCYVLSWICQKECQKKCQKACQKICHKESAKIYQKECQKICQQEFQKINQKNVRRYLRRYVRKNVQRKNVGRLLPVSLRSWE